MHADSNQEGVQWRAAEEGPKHGFKGAKDVRLKVFML